MILAERILLLETLRRFGYTKAQYAGEMGFMSFEKLELLPKNR